MCGQWRNWMHRCPTKRSARPARVGKPRLLRGSRPATIEVLGHGPGPSVYDWMWEAHASATAPASTPAAPPSSLASSAPSPGLASDRIAASIKEAYVEADRNGRYGIHEQRHNRAALLVSRARRTMATPVTVGTGDQAFVEPFQREQLNQYLLGVAATVLDEDEPGGPRLRGARGVYSAGTRDAARKIHYALIRSGPAEAPPDVYQDGFYRQPDGTERRTSGLGHVALALLNGVERDQSAAAWGPTSLSA